MSFLILKNIYLNHYDFNAQQQQQQQQHFPLLWYNKVIFS
jgi:hypothetical protein